MGTQYRYIPAIRKLALNLSNEYSCICIARKQKFCHQTETVLKPIVIIVSPPSNRSLLIPSKILKAAIKLNFDRQLVATLLIELTSLHDI